MPVFTPVTDAEFAAAIADLAAQIGGEGWADLIVGIGRGGLVPAVYLSHATGLPMVSLDGSGGQAPDLATLAGRLKGRRAVIVDDINDSGRTIARLRAGLAEAGAGEVRFAVLIDNSASAEQVDYRHRVIDRRTVKDWFVFPWEAVASATAIEADAAEVPDRIG
ncbi:hypothetical protein GCM10011380_30500 [Sphingomonas metalli]|uniref:Phosphoribosyltransferase domain-containing protein n=1 Tax=Sphingomonas metalli TaxID=1779358 RepID=A0A916TCL7_9SPHN|nr:phosphoribosyltransferase family protein [Sphingomonas metalli]GGB38942.1 hypothetical protein GCM10011380_30500 [Sphingomonas metalli]